MKVRVFARGIVNGCVFEATCAAKAEIALGESERESERERERVRDEEGRLSNSSPLPSSTSIWIMCAALGRSHSRVGCLITWEGERDEKTSGERRERGREKGERGRQRERGKERIFRIKIKRDDESRKCGGGGKRRSSSHRDQESSESESKRERVREREQKRLV